MATDGVKIIDGDLAYDVYGMFMVDYDQGADVAELVEKYQRDKGQYSFDDECYEIYITVCALAFWEIGELTPDILADTEAVIAKGAGVAGWTEEVGEKAGKARQKELDKLLAKISVPNTKIRKRKKYAKVKNLVFEIGDVLAFQLPDNTWGMTIVTDIMQYCGECDYSLCRTSFNAAEKPAMEKLPDLRIYGSFVPTGRGGGDMDVLGMAEKMATLSIEEMKDGAIDKLLHDLMRNNPKLKMPWVRRITHKDLNKDEFKSHFEKIGNVPLRSNCCGSVNAYTYDDFCDDFYAKDWEFSTDNFKPEVGEFTVEELQRQPYQE